MSAIWNSAACSCSDRASACSEPVRWRRSSTASATGASSAQARSSNAASACAGSRSAMPPVASRASNRTPRPPSAPSATGSPPACRIASSAASAAAASPAGTVPLVPSAIHHATVAGTAPASASAWAIPSASAGSEGDCSSASSIAPSASGSPNGTVSGAGRDACVVIGEWPAWEATRSLTVTAAGPADEGRGAPNAECVRPITPGQEGEAARWRKRPTSRSRRATDCCPAPPPGAGGCRPHRGAAATTSRHQDISRSAPCANARGKLSLTPFCWFLLARMPGRSPRSMPCPAGCRTRLLARRPDG